MSGMWKWLSYFLPRDPFDRVTSVLYMATFAALQLAIDGGLIPRSPIFGVPTDVALGVANFVFWLALWAIVKHVVLPRLQGARFRK